MSIGSSGRIVIEVDPDVKRRLYALLAREGLSLKEWFLRNAISHIELGTQGTLFETAPASVTPSRETK